MRKCFVCIRTTPATYTLPLAIARTLRAECDATVIGRHATPARTRDSTRSHIRTTTRRRLLRHATLKRCGGVCYAAVVNMIFSCSRAPPNMHACATSTTTAYYAGFRDTKVSPLIHAHSHTICHSHRRRSDRQTRRSYSESLRAQTCRRVGAPSRMLHHFTWRRLMNAVVVVGVVGVGSGAR